MDIPDGLYSIVFPVTSYVFDVFQAESAPGAAVGVYPVWDQLGSHQIFRIFQIDNECYAIAAAHSGRALNVCGGSWEDGAAIIQWGDGTGRNEQFYIVDCPTGCVSFISRLSGRAITVNMQDNKLYQTIYRGLNTQQFRLVCLLRAETERALLEDIARLGYVEYQKREKHRPLNLPFPIRFLIYRNGTDGKEHYTMTDTEYRDCIEAAWKFADLLQSHTDGDLLPEIQIKTIEREIVADKAAVSGMYQYPGLNSVLPDLEDCSDKAEFYSLLSLTPIRSYLGMCESWHVTTKTGGYATVSTKWYGDGHSAPELSNTILHEFLHQFEAFTSYLNAISVATIQMPEVHLYIKMEENGAVAGYEPIYGNHSKDFGKSYYTDLLRANVQFTDESGVRYLGIFPSMWKSFIELYRAFRNPDLQIKRGREPHF